MFIEAWRQLIVLRMLCYGMFFLAKFLSERCCGQGAPEDEWQEWTEAEWQDWQEGSCRAWKESGWQDWTADEWQQWQNREWQAEDWQRGEKHHGGWQQQAMHTRNSTERLNVFGEPEGVDPHATGSEQDGGLWNEPDGGDIQHLLEEADENGDGAESARSNDTYGYNI